jgi:hypothetical protein
MLWELCHDHPQIRMTKEFGNYTFIGDPLPVYAKRVAGRLWRIRGRWRVYAPPGEHTGSPGEGVYASGANHIANTSAATHHLLRLARRGIGPVTVTDLAEEARKNDTETEVVGDKWPRYVFEMDRLTRMPELKRLVVFRDCRDVVSSFMVRIRTDWKNEGWIRNWNTAAKVAGQWVSAIETMERHADLLFIIRYEELVRDPQSSLAGLAEWLHVDSAGFDVDSVKASSIGKYRQGLTPEELDDVMRVAGPTLERLNYAVD